MILNYIKYFFHSLYININKVYFLCYEEKNVYFGQNEGP